MKATGADGGAAARARLLMDSPIAPLSAGRLGEGWHRRVLFKLIEGHVVWAVLGEALSALNLTLAEVKVERLAQRLQIDMLEIADGCTASTADVAAELSRHEGVKFAHPDSVLRVRHTSGGIPPEREGVPSAVTEAAGNAAAAAAGRRLHASSARAVSEADGGDPSDPIWPTQWDKRAIGAVPESAGTAGAWERSTGNRSVVVCVIDTGIDYTHPDLAGNMWRNPGEIPGNGIDDDGNGYVDDVFGYNFVEGNAEIKDYDIHGTHCAGTPPILIGISLHKAVKIC